MPKTRKYVLTPEHEAQFSPWRDRWIAHAMSTTAMSEADRNAMRVAIRGLYQSADLTPPPDDRIVFVPSPFVARFAGGFAAALWWMSQHPSEEWATGAATRAATEAATEAATWAATEAATRAATWAATLAATGAATWAATLAATGAATRAATGAATRATTGAATWAATEAAGDITGVDIRALLMVADGFAPGRAVFLVSCVTQAWNLWNGGNQWPGWPTFLSFFRHVACLPLDYSKWQHYEAAAIHGGPRVMHPEFCIVSDRPVRLLVDDQNRPHCDDGPFCAWRDGSALWAWHGVRVPAWLVMDPHRLTVTRIQEEENAEVRRVMLERYGFDRYLTDSGALPIHADETGTLYRCELKDDEPIVMVSVRNSTPEPDGSYKQYQLRVPPDITTARAAVAWTFDQAADNYAPVMET